MNYAHGGRREKGLVIRRLPVPVCVTDMFRASNEVATRRSLLQEMVGGGFLSHWDLYRVGCTIALVIHSFDPIQSLDLFARLIVEPNLRI